MFCVCLPGLRIFAIFHSIFVAVPKGSHCRFDHLIWTCDALPRIKNHLMSHQVLVQCGKKHLLHIGPQLYPISRQLPGRAPWRAKRVATCCLFCEKAFARLEWASFILCFFLNLRRSSSCWQAPKRSRKKHRYRSLHDMCLLKMNIVSDSIH